MFWRWKSIGLTIGRCLSKKHLAKAKAYFVDEVYVDKGKRQFSSGTMSPPNAHGCFQLISLRKEKLNLITT